MGNLTSSNNRNETFSDSFSQYTKDNTSLNETLLEDLSDIAFYFIHTMSENDLKNLATGNNEYCKNLIIISQKILNEYFTPYQIKSIYETTLKIDNKSVSNKEKKDDTLYYFTYNNQLFKNISEDNLDICKEISKYYVKIAHIFSVIVYALDPVKKTNGQIVRENISNKNIKLADVEFNGICENRYNYLLLDIFNKIDHDKDSDDKLDINKDNLKCKNKSNIDNTLKNTSLKYLFENNTDYNENIVKKMKNLHNKYSELRNKDEFDIDDNRELKDKLNKYYIDYKKNISNENKKLNNDIKFNLEEVVVNNSMVDKDTDYICREIYSKNSQNIQIKRNHKLIKNYMKHLKNMLLKMTLHKKLLVNVLNNELFEKNSKSKKFRINSNLSINKLNELTVYVRKVIISMYLTCEENYLQGIKILEKIVEHDKKVNNSDYKLTEELEKKRLEESRENIVYSQPSYISSYTEPYSTEYNNPSIYTQNNTYSNENSNRKGSFNLSNL